MVHCVFRFLSQSHTDGFITSLPNPASTLASLAWRDHFAWFVLEQLITVPTCTLQKSSRHCFWKPRKALQKDMPEGEQQRNN